ncbi:MAG: hypothetical protein C0501_10490 [Isosphaera sp.]|nr:hypothetical protein [Isosphaera sp.]
MKYKIKWWFLLKFTVLLVALGVAVHLVHARQVKKQFGAYLDQAKKAKDADDPGREAEYLDRYLKAVPDDIDARERLARLYCRTATRPRDLENAYYALEDVLRRDPNRDELRKYAVEFATGPKVGLFKEARGHVEVLLAKGPDADLEATRGKCLLAEGKFADAAEAYRKSYELKPTLVDSYAARAVVLRRHLNQPTQADRVIDDMRAANEKDFRAHLVAAEYWQTFAPLDRGADAAAAVAKAFGIAPKERDVLLMSADFARFRARNLFRDGKPTEAAAALDEARNLLDVCTREHPKTVEAYRARAALETDPKKAVEVVDRGLKAVPDSPELTHELFEYQFQAKDKAGAIATAEKLYALPAVRPEVVEYEKARVLFLQGKWTEAAPALAAVVPKLPHGPGSARRRANLLLGQAYEQLGEHQRRLDALTRAEGEPERLGVDDPLWAPVAYGIAEANVALGRTAAALDAYRRLADRAPAAWAQIARLEIARAVRNPEGMRDWAAAEEALAKAEEAVREKRIPDLLDIRLLRAHLLDQKGDRAGARQRLDELKASNPKDPAVWVELAMLSARAKDLDAAFATLDEAEKRGPGDGTELRVARARLLFEKWRVTDRKDKTIAAQVADLGKGAGKFDPDQQARMFRALFEIAALMGADAEATRLVDAAAQLRPDDLTVHALRFDRAARKPDLGVMELVLKDIAKIDGEKGQSTRAAQAAVLLQRAKEKKDPAEARAVRDQAMDVLNGLEAEKVGPPLDARVALSQGLVHDLNFIAAGPGTPAAQASAVLAAERYQRAFDLGETNPQALLRLAFMYSFTRQYAKAVEVYKKLPEALASDPKVQRMASGATLGAGLPPEDALALAVKAIPETSTDPQALLYLSQLYLATGDKKKPEELMRRATVLRPDAADAHLLLIQFYAGTGRREDAEKAFKEAADKVKAADKTMFAAAGHALLGQVADARKAMAKAREDKPDDPATLFAEADYLLQLGLLAEAGEAYTRIGNLPSAPAAVKRTALLKLAIATAINPDYRVSSTAPKLVEQAGLGNTPEDNLARVIVLAFQKDRSRRLEAVKLLEKIPKRSKVEAFMLAQLYHSVGDRVKGRGELLSALLDEKDKKQWAPLHVAYLIQSLLRDGDLAAAEKWVAHLAETDPDSVQTAVLRARLYVARKDPRRAQEVLLAKEKTPNLALGPLARLYEELGLYEDAERVLNLAIAQAEKVQPDAVLARAAFFGRRDRTKDALDVIEKEKGRLPPTSVGGILVDVLYKAKAPAPEDIKKATDWLDGAVGRAVRPQEKATLNQQLGSLWNLQGDFVKAAEFYRKALEGNPHDLIALNNLAYLLSTHPKTPEHNEALALITRAKAVVGENPDIRDTEATILLNKGDAGTAADILEGVIAENPTGTGYFHLAQAQLAKKNEGAARDAWSEARKLNLQRTDLHPNERTSYDDFARRFR